MKKIKDILLGLLVTALIAGSIFGAFAILNYVEKKEAREVYEAWVVKPVPDGGKIKITNFVWDKNVEIFGIGFIVNEDGKVYLIETYKDGVQAIRELGVSCDILAEECKKENQAAYAVNMDTSVDKDGTIHASLDLKIDNENNDSYVLNLAVKTIIDDENYIRQTIYDEGSEKVLYEDR